MLFVLIKVNPGDIKVAIVDETHIINSQMVNENTCPPHASHVMSHDPSQSNTACGVTVICQTTFNTRTRRETRLLFTSYTLRVCHLFWLLLLMFYRGDISNWMWMCLWSPTRGSQSNAKTIANYCVKTCYSFTADSSNAAGSKWQYSMEIHFWLLMIYAKCMYHYSCFQNKWRHCNKWHIVFKFTSFGQLQPYIQTE